MKKEIITKTIQERLSQTEFAENELRILRFLCKSLQKEKDDIVTLNLDDISDCLGYTVAMDNNFENELFGMQGKFMDITHDIELPGGMLSFTMFGAIIIDYAERTFMIEYSPQYRYIFDIVIDYCDEKLPK